MGHDPIKYALWIGVFSGAITLACGLYIAWINGGSRNLALGLGALAGACVIFGMQILFELKGNTASSDFVAEFVVDYQEMAVRSSRAYVGRWLSLRVTGTCSLKPRPARPLRQRHLRSPRMTRRKSRVTLGSFQSSHTCSMSNQTGNLTQGLTRQVQVHSLNGHGQANQKSAA